MELSFIAELVKLFLSAETYEYAFSSNRIACAMLFLNEMVYIVQYLYVYFKITPKGFTDDK